MYEAAHIAGIVSPEQMAFAEGLGRLAAEAVAPTVIGRAQEQRFDRDLWRALAAGGYVGAMVPTKLGGAGQDARALMMALDAFVAEGHDLGLGVSLNVHNQLLRYLFMESATDEQREQYLPGLLAGDKLTCLAVSEPETGAHPRHLKTCADRDGDTYYLTGRKAYITNGPEADLLIVVAVTDDSGPHKGISAFLVERDWPGVEISEPMDLGFLRTSPHARVQFTRTPVPAANLIGPEHEAYRTMVRGFRDHEDAFGCALFSGLLAWQLHETILGEPGAAAAAGEDTAVAIAEAHASLEVSRLTGVTLAAHRDAGEVAEDAEGALVDACGVAFRAGTDAIGAAWDAWTPAADAPISRARSELGMAGIAGRVRSIRRAQRGRRVAQAGRRDV